MNEAAAGTTVADTIEVVVSAVGDDTLTIIVVVVSVEGLGLDDEFGGDDIEENSFVGRGNIEHLTSRETFILDIRKILPQVVDVDIVLGGASKGGVNVLAAFRFLTVGARVGDGTGSCGLKIGAEVQLLGDFVGLGTLRESDDILHGDGVEFISGGGVDFDALEEVSTFDTSGTVGGEGRSFFLLMVVTSGRGEEGDFLVVRVGGSRRRNDGNIVVVVVHGSLDVHHSIACIVGCSSNGSLGGGRNDVLVLVIVVVVVHCNVGLFLVYVCEKES